MARQELCRVRDEAAVDKEFRDADLQRAAEEVRPRWRRRAGGGPRVVGLCAPPVCAPALRAVEV